MQLSVEILAYMVLIVLVISFGTIGTYWLGSTGNFNVPIHSVITALYFTISTISTVGYGDIVPVTGIARIFDIILILSGLGVFLSAVTILASGFVNNRIDALTGRISYMERKLFKQHMILIGYSPTNESIAKTLKAEKKRFIILVSDKTLADHLRTEGYHAFIVDETSESELLSYGLKYATKVVIDIRDKSRTLFVALLVKEIVGKDRFIVVVDNAEAEKHLRSMNITEVINPAKIAADSISAKLLKLGK